ncbi:venom carboxylesterase-6-like [Zerene cesonia]|uniref:venom carboxylesterase-6-like n=1 Tax=Zerene cesonia TaxID=33412 RepID=UPI0018E54A99|nr:venom carboxylesterase-6-like [Zerene cesonia]
MLVFLFLFAIAYAQDNLSVNTTQGVVIGSRASDGNYYSFYGIHYAGSTAGQNRFKAPTPAPVYPGDYHAIDTKIICAQPTSRGLVGVEDCLVLNVFTPNATTKDRPVLVWLESEQYTTTRQKLYSVKKLVEEDLVVVSMNYRLSIFGFLCLGVPDAPGNAGLKDVIQGLQWIKNNIAGFGGNPNNVVLLGHSSGAAIAELITLSPLSQGLVHKVIAISGSALSPWAVAYEPIKYAESLGEKLQYVGKSRAQLAAAFASTDINVLAPVLNDFEFFNNTPLFAPCIEDRNLNINDSVLTDAPINLLRNGNYSHVPYIAAFVDKEGTIRAEQAAFRNWLNKMQNNFTDFVQVDLKFESAQNKSAVAQSIREYYFAQRAINMETIEDFLDYQGDTMILVSVIRGIAERAATSRSPVRLLEFAFRGTHHSDWAYPQIPVTGAKHGAMLNYLFDFDLRSGDYPVQNSLLKRFSAFARNGDPNPANTAVVWNPYTAASTITLRLSGEDTISSSHSFQEEVRVNVHQQRMGFWNNIFAIHYTPPQASSAARIISLTLVLISCVLALKLL